MFVGPTHLAEASALVPFVVGILVLGALSVAVTSAIDGTQRADERALVMMASAGVFLLTSWLLIPQVGIVGFGMAQLIQQLATIALGWVVLRRHVADLGWVPHHWRREVFIETTGYALKLNAIAIVGLLFEPLTKFAFNHVGGPGLVAVYELASRLVIASPQRRHCRCHASDASFRSTEQQQRSCVSGHAPKGDAHICNSLGGSIAGYDCWCAVDECCNPKSPVTGDAHHERSFDSWLEFSAPVSRPLPRGTSAWCAALELRQPCTGCIICCDRCDSSGANVWNDRPHRGNHGRALAEFSERALRECARARCNRYSMGITMVVNRHQRGHHYAVCIGSSEYEFTITIMTIAI